MYLSVYVTDCNRTCMGMGIQFFPHYAGHFSTELNESCKLYVNQALTLQQHKAFWHTVYLATLSFTVFSFIVAVTACCHPPHHHRRPIVWLGEGVSYHGGRYNGGIDTGDPMRSARSLRPCFSFHGWVKHPQQLFQVPACRCWHKQSKEGSVSQVFSSLLDKDKSWLHPDKLVVMLPHPCVYVLLINAFW